MPRERQLAPGAGRSPPPPPSPPAPAAAETSSPNNSSPARSPASPDPPTPSPRTPPPTDSCAFHLFVLSASCRPPPVFMMQSTDARHLHDSALTRQLHSPRLGCVFRQR